MAQLQHSLLAPRARRRLATVLQQRGGGISSHDSGRSSRPCLNNVYTTYCTQSTVLQQYIASKLILLISKRPLRYCIALLLLLQVQAIAAVGYTAIDYYCVQCRLVQGYCYTVTTECVRMCRVTSTEQECYYIQCSSILTENSSDGSATTYPAPST